MKAYKLVCPCLLGVEGLVADELREMGAENVLPENGRVVFDGSPLSLTYDEVIREILPTALHPTLA